MIKKSIAMICMSAIMIGCGQKYMVIPVSDVDKLAVSHKVIEPKKPEQKRVIRHDLYLPKQAQKKIYSTHEYARYMYESDCEELKFRKDALLDRDVKYYAIDTMEVLIAIEKNMKKYHCK